MMMNAYPASCPKCDRMFGIANYVERGETVDGRNVRFIICECGYVKRHS